MQVKVLNEPLKLADLYQAFDVLVLPIFIEASLHDPYYFDDHLRKTAIRKYLGSHGVDVIALPENVVVLFICVEKRHNRKRILKNAKRLYMKAVSEDYAEYDVPLKGYHSSFLCVASGDPLSDYYAIPKSGNTLSIYTGCGKLDRVYRRLINSGELARFTPNALAHPTVRVSFERLIIRTGRDCGYDVEIINIMRHGKKAFITCDIMELEVSS